MKLITKSPVTFSTVKRIGRLLKSLVEHGLISQSESNEQMANLRHLSQKDEMILEILQRLIEQK